MNWFTQFPDRNQLLELYSGTPTKVPLKINNHIHTPYSFSAFASIKQAVEMAANEEVRVLGINDFYVTDGYGKFIKHCTDHSVFPLLNIELIGISKEHRKNNIRVNDINNPGRIYISGKGLAYPVVLTENQQQKLDRVLAGSQRQVSQMIDLLNAWLLSQDLDISLSVAEIMENHAHKLLRERHIAKVMRLKLEDRAVNDTDFYELISKIYGGKTTEKQRADIAGIEEELRSGLLKSGAPAFVPEDDQAFLWFDEIIELIKDAGGIPTYPLLLDGAGGHITEFENNKEQLHKVLRQYGIKSIEFMPFRNSFQKLKEYAEYFYDKGFVVSFGTEHNTTAMRPVTVSCKGDIPLKDSLMRISYMGAAYVAAHQYLVAREGKNYNPGSRDDMEKLGLAIFQYYFNTLLPSLPGKSIKTSKP
ncbi:MAG: hypothetical protein U9N53_02790 [Bacteroidota bacterium]|nr:hypothetical protein [Bacteroidota bacterium]